MSLSSSSGLMIHQADQQMKFLRPLVGFSTKDHIRNIMRSQLKETRIMEDYERYKLQWTDNLLGTDNT
jgi:hypothetical protein